MRLLQFWPWELESSNHDLNIPSEHRPGSWVVGPQICEWDKSMKAQLAPFMAQLHFFFLIFVLKCSWFFKITICVLSHVRLFATLGTVACRALLSMEFSRQEYWSGLPFLMPGDLPDPGIEPTSLVSPALVVGFFTTVLPGKPVMILYLCIK